MKDDLTKLAIKHGTDKATNGYTPIYEKYLRHKRDKNNNVLEIGVWYGSSLRMWAEYFTNSFIMGMDIPHEMYPRTIFPYQDYQARNDLVKSIKNSGLYLGDQANPDHLSAMFRQLEKATNRGSVDVVIDDGSHFQHDIMKSLAYIFPRLSSGGIYIIEDICKREDLENGSMWWGHSQEEHHHKQNFRTDEEWLAGNNINYDNCVDSTITGYIENKLFKSNFLTEQQTSYIQKNIDYVDYYGSADLQCDSKIAIIVKK